MTPHPLIAPVVIALAARSALSIDGAGRRRTGAGLAATALAAPLLMPDEARFYPAWLGPLQSFHGFLPYLPAALGALFLVAWSFGSADPRWMRLVSALCGLAMLLPFILLILFASSYRE